MADGTRIRWSGQPDDDWDTGRIHLSTGTLTGSKVMGWLAFPPFGRIVLEGFADPASAADGLATLQVAQRDVMPFARRHQGR